MIHSINGLHVSVPRLTAHAGFMFVAHPDSRRSLIVRLNSQTFDSELIHHPVSGWGCWTSSLSFFGDSATWDSSTGCVLFSSSFCIFLHISQCLRTIHNLRWERRKKLLAPLTHRTKRLLTPRALVRCSDIPCLMQ